MKIIQKNEFSKSLDNILDYIALDSLNRAKNFNRQLQRAISSISHMPYKYRKSLYYDDNDIRDMIFKGYTITYLIDTEKEIIVILDIFKWIDK